MQCLVYDLTINYELRGDADGYPLVMLHGWSTDHRHCMSAMEPLFNSRPGWKRIYFDLPGMGKSPAHERIDSHDALLQVVLDFVDAIIPGQQFALGGISRGGYLARGVVYRRAEQVDGLLLMVPVIKNPIDERSLPSHTILVADAALLAEIPNEEAELLRGVAVVQSREFLESMRRDLLPAFALADDAALARIDQHKVFSFDPDALPAPFPAPALIVVGRQDAICGYRDAWTIIENYPRATFAVLDRAGHGLGDEQKGLFRALAAQWLDRVEEYRQAGSMRASDERTN